MKFLGSTEAINQIQTATSLSLFLDYDGTLADFAPTPDDILPDTELIELITQLADLPNIEIAVISGRRLDHILMLLPINSILLAGTYGIEIRTADGRRIDRLDIQQIRPVLDQLKPMWAKLIDRRKGYYLEDKNWSLALHARLAEVDDAQFVLDQAKKISMDLLRDNVFRILGGDKFLEVAPRIANKGSTIHYLLDRSPLGSSLPVYVGDDDKDEEAFETILSLGGVAIKVGGKPRISVAQLRLKNPQDVRQWLRSLLPGSH